MALQWAIHSDTPSTDSGASGGSITFVALGSLGDAVPLANLAAAWVSAGVRRRAHVLISTDCGLNADPVVHAQCGSAAAVTVQRLPIPALAPSVAAAESSQAGAGTHDSGEGPRLSGRPESDLDVLYAAVAATAPHAVLFNLWSVAAFHVADALAVPCAIVSPAPASPAAAAAAERAVARLLRQERALCAVVEEDDERTPLPSRFGSVRANLLHWMAPLLTDPYPAWRAAHGLAPLPALLSPDRAASVPVLYGCSAALLPPPGFWPANAHVVGWWGGCASAPAPCAIAASFIASAARCDQLTPSPVVYIGFGSMTGLGLAPSAEAQLDAAEEVAATLGAAVIAHVPGESRAAEGKATEAAASETTVQRVPACDCGVSLSGRVLMLRHSVDLGALLPVCAAAVHHGGAGTVHACAVAGVVQAVVPFVYDQRMWAERLAYLGVAPQPPASADVQSFAATGDGVWLAAHVAAALRLCRSCTAHRPAPGPRASAGAGQPGSAATCPCSVHTLAAAVRADSGTAQALAILAETTLKAVP
jgi:hypothetical protein